ncbi:hypothetical protein C5472_20235 [Photorhabdus sp. RW14-46]|uniref:Photorhabdus luminescens subsp. laumondii TTO1 complete genome segment 12/17 n=4 Tax=Morganellaceae TaxID=1903414 RepID=Q7N1J2_PHOLL|nr:MULTISPECIES: hypothetical protein [Photorhabdus]AKH63867.1 hypothetical protein VY86_11550 [Photorhabdus thracensis]AWK43137.1 hypothetical protein A4R40_17335 [Photorhabdus laumondii subsp. laumondii]AXG48451.1 hypothetical protein PluTT01m_17890 [Photorhabdus laumondii subsp. laumondii]NHB63349.1 hypothetical protein [Photorhabdus sp. RW14-46]CAE15855.1 unnamed protein product [Photorhabdus laumondii subsp. laumondii TTO1]
MFTYICVFEPTKKAQKNGAVPLAIALEANSEKMAKAMAIVYLGEEYADDMSNFNTSKPIICKDIQGFPRPPIGKFDEKFATEYEFNGTTWQARTLEPKKNPSITTRDFNHTYATLDLEIALALLDGDFHCWAIMSHSMKEAKQLITNNNEAWRQWSTAFRIRTDALSIPRETLFRVVREGKHHPEFLTDAVAIKEFLNCTLSDTDIPVELPEEKPKVSNYSVSTSEASITDVTPDEVETQQAALQVKEKKSEAKSLKTRKTKQTKEDKAVEETAQDNTTADDEVTSLPPVATLSTNDDNFQHRANLLEETIKAQGNEQQTNLRIWKAVQRTDPHFTKPLEGMGFNGTSINSNYMFMRATELFGPFGYGWGCNVTEEKLINGAPMSEPIYDDKNKQIGSRFLRDSDGTLICEQNHSIKILFWYLVECDICAEIESYGATPYMYRTKYGIKTDGEAIKKSLTDAIKKALSMLGFSADVFMGMHDNPEYLADNNIEFEIKAASDKAEDLVRLRKELDDKFTRNTETMRTAVSKNEIRGIASTLIRELSIHLGNSKAKGDKDYEKYLSGRLRRLNEIEKECLTQLEEANQ